MTESPSDRPPRRPRYRGTHPRLFHEKYKELQPDRYPADVAKVLDGGKTPAGTHRPILVDEVLQLFELRPGDAAVDSTLGYGGHAAAMLKAVQPGGQLFGFDVDPIELPKTECRLRAGLASPESLTVWRRNFAGMAQVLAAVAPQGVRAVFADLGVSSMQLDDPARGFSFKWAGPLDMRMNPLHGQSAADLLSQWAPADLTQILSDYADEPLADQLAVAILGRHARRPLQTTIDLAKVVRSEVNRKNRSSTAAEETVRRVFQALRIAVNDELQALDAFLRQVPGCLEPGGRVVVLTFHSGEDRRVKAAFKKGLQDGVYTRIAEEVLRASVEEQRANPRSSSAKLRFAIRSSGQAAD